jgi:hypothetical protein
MYSDAHLSLVIYDSDDLVCQRVGGEYRAAGD